MVPTYNFHLEEEEKKDLQNDMGSKLGQLGPGYKLLKYGCF